MGTSREHKDRAGLGWAERGPGPRGGVVVPEAWGLELSGLLSKGKGGLRTET